MKYLKFNLVLIPFLALALGAVAYVARSLLFEGARQQVLQNARLLMEAAASSRTYTTKQVAPLLQQKEFKLEAALDQLRKVVAEISSLPNLPPPAKDLRGKNRKAPPPPPAPDASQQLLESIRGKPEELADADFHPQSVPAFAATAVFGYLRENFPDYFYKEATLNPTNPRDRATDWESDVVNLFRNGLATEEFINTRDTSTRGAALFLARPIKVNNASCLECHTTPDQAPPAMIKQYGSDHGFGWKLNEIIGAQIVSVPLSVPVQSAEKAFHVLFAWLGGAGIVILLIANLAVWIVTRPSKPFGDKTFAQFSPPHTEQRS